MVHVLRLGLSIHLELSLGQQGIYQSVEGLVEAVFESIEENKRHHAYPLV